MADSRHFNWHEVKERLPQGNGFRFIACADVSEGEVRARFYMVPTHQILEAHFPGDPIVPGVIILEAMAQACGLYLGHNVPDAQSKKWSFAGVDKVRWRQNVRPGDILEITVRLEKDRSGFYYFDAKAKVGEELACEARLTLGLGLIEQQVQEE